MDAIDLLIVGGGINGAAIARDAAGRGLSVLLVEKDDLAAHTSSASSKLVHGGLRYLEQFELGLVREALRERRIMLHTAPHLVRPLRFVLPDPPGGRPWWMIRLGLFGYDLLAGRGGLPRARAMAATERRLADPLKPGFRLATYWDAAVDDARLVVANAIDAGERGAEIASRTALVSARRAGDAWEACLTDGRDIRARAIVNAGGPWVCEVMQQRLGVASASRVRLVKGSHILLPRLWEGDQAYILQQADGRVVFALPYGSHSLVGTTDIPVDDPEEAQVSAGEIDYLCAAANAFFRQSSAPSDVVWSYSGVRSLFDDGSAQAKDVTRDYRLELDEAGPKLLSLFGGKITTARALAEEALERLGISGGRWTAEAPLPGAETDPEASAILERARAWAPPDLLDRLEGAYGTRAADILGSATDLSGLGRSFGAGLHEAEVRHLVEREYARTAEDVLWRRSKLGLRMTTSEAVDLRDFLEPQGPS